MGVKKLIELMGQVLVDVSIGALIADKLQRNNKSHAADVEPRQDPVIKLGVDASCPIHNLLRRHAKDIILRSSWLSFRSSVRQLLTSYISWAASKNNPAAMAGLYTAAKPCPFLLMVLDGARLSSKQVNSQRSIDRSTAQAALLQHFTTSEIEDDSYYSVDDKILGQAIGGYNIEAMHQFIEVCNELGVPWEIAPCEAEHQLGYLQKEGDRVQYILTYDSDAIALGCSNVFLDIKHHMHLGMVKYFSRPSKVLDGEVLRKLQLRHVVELQKQQMPRLSGQNKNKITAGAKQDFVLAEIFMRDGFRFIEIARCVLRSDYNFFPAVGTATVIRLYRVMLQNREASTPGLRQNMSAEESAQAVHEHIKSMTVREIFSNFAELLFRERLGKNSVSADERLPDVVTLIANAAPVAVDCITLAAPTPMALDALDATTPMYVDTFADERLLDGVLHVQHVASTLIENAAPMPPVDFIAAPTPMYVHAFPDERLIDGVSHVQHVASTNAAPMHVDFIAAAAPMALAPMIIDAAPKAVECIVLQVDAVQGAAEAAQYSTEAEQRAAEHATPKAVVIQKCDCPCCFDSFLIGRRLTQRDIIVRMESAWIMFKYPLVRSSVNELTTLNPVSEQSLRDELQFHSLHDLNIHIGRDHFNGIDIKLFANGAYDVRDLTLKPHHPIVHACDTASDSVVLNPEEPVLLMLSDLPSESEIRAMTVSNLEKWLKIIKKPHSVGLKEEKRDRLLSAVKMCRAVGMLPDDAAPTEDESRVIGTAVNEAYALIDLHRTEWKSAFEMKDDPLRRLPALPMDLIESFKNIHNLTSSRLQFIGTNRYCNHVLMYSGPSRIMCGQQVHDLHTLTEVARSSTHAFRQVYGHFIVDDLTNTVLWILEMICLIPRGVIDAQGNISPGVVNDSYTACRGSFSECGHTLAALIFTHEGGINASSTSAARLWGTPGSRKRATHTALIKSVHPAEHFFDHASRVDFNPYRLQHRTEIEKGMGSPLYCGKLLEHIRIKKEEIDLYATNSAHVGRELKIETLNLFKRAARAEKIQRAGVLKARDNRLLRCAKLKAAEIAKAALITTLPPNITTKDGAIMNSNVLNTGVHLKAAADAQATVLPVAASARNLGGRPPKRTRIKREVQIPAPDQQAAVQVLTCICRQMCKGHKVSFILLPKDSKHNSRRSEFVAALGLTANAFKASGKCYIHVGHFEPSMFAIGKNGKKYLKVNSQAIPCAFIVTHFEKHDDFLLLIREAEASQIKAPKRGHSRICICFGGAACSDNLRLQPSNRVPRNKSLRLVWYKILSPHPTADQLRRLKNGNDLHVDRRHFHKDHLTYVGASDLVTVREGCLPNRVHVPFEQQWSDTHNMVPAPMLPITTEAMLFQERTSTTDLYNMGNLRQAVLDITKAGSLSSSVSMLEKIIDSRVQMALTNATAALAMNVEPALLAAAHPVHVNSILGWVQTDPHYCRTHTGEPSWKSIISFFDYLDADKALSSMHITWSRHAKSNLTSQTDTSKVANMRKRTAIPPLHQLLVFLLMAKTFLNDVETLALSFDITEQCAFRYYDSHCAALSFFQLYHQPVPTYEEMVEATPANLRSVAVAHGAPAGSAVIVSDCTEVKLFRSKKIELFTVSYSVYKGCNTVKTPTFAVGTGYLFPLSLTGPCDDDEVLKASGIASILFQAMEEARRAVGVDREAEILISMLYDKGLSNWTFLEKMGIYVLCPDKAKPKQMIFGQKSSRTSRELASGRIIVENINAVLKEYTAFANTKRLDRLDMTLHEFNAVRFLINLQPVINNWASMSQHSFEQDTDAVLHRNDLPRGKCGCALCKSLSKSKS